MSISSDKADTCVDSYVSPVMSGLSVSFEQSYSKFMACKVLFCVEDCPSLIEAAYSLESIADRKASSSKASFSDWWRCRVVTTRQTVSAGKTFTRFIFDGECITLKV